MPHIPLNRPRAGRESVPESIARGPLVWFTETDPSSWSFPGVLAPGDFAITDAGTFWFWDGTLWTQIDPGGGAAPANADYLIGTAQAGLNNGIVVGSIPGGELSGTWAVPTVGVTHSGSSHAGVVSAHEALPTIHHSNADDHVAVTLSVPADSDLLSLVGQELGLDAQIANLVFAGPPTGLAEGPAFRALVDADIPASIARDSEIDAHEALPDAHHSNADDHAEAHTLTSHSSRAHSELTGVGAADHHGGAIGIQFDDTVAVSFGTGSDATILYDGTNLVINPKAVGSGVMVVQGDIDISGHIAIGASAGISTTLGEVLTIAESSTDISGDIRQLDITMSVAPTGASAAANRGLFLSVANTTAQAITGNMTGLQFIVDHVQSVNVAALYGLFGQVRLGTGTGDTSTPSLGGGGGAANGRGIYGQVLIQCYSGSGAATVVSSKAAAGWFDVQQSTHGAAAITSAELIGTYIRLNFFNDANTASVTTLSGIHVDPALTTSTGVIIGTGILCRLGAWPSGPTYTNGPYGVSQEGVGDTNWFAGPSYFGETARISAATALLAKVTIDQQSATAAIPPLKLDQADISEGLIDFIASARGVITGATNSVDSVRVELNGVVYRLALYADA